MTTPLHAPTRFEKAASPVFLVGMTCYLLLHCWITSGHKALWMDEIVSWTLVADSSFSHALAALAHGADGGFPSYYFVAWPVAHLFGPGEFAVRVVSSVFMAAAFSLLYGVLRRTYGIVPAMLAVTLSIGGSTLILYQNSELRFYADLVFSAAVAVSGFDLVFRRSEAERWPWGAMAWNALGHALLVLCHPFGIAYSAAISFAALATFFLVRPRNFLAPFLASMAVGCAFFLLWVRGFLQQTHIIAGKSHLPVPSVADFFRIYAQLAPSFYYDDRTKAWAAGHLLPVKQHLALLGAVGVLVVGGLLVAGLVARSLFSKQPAAAETGEATAERRAFAPADGHLLLLAAAFVLVPAGVWVTSHLGKSLFIHRYFIPSVLGFAILYAHVFARVGQRAAARGIRATPPMRAAGAGAALLFAALYAAWPLGATLTAPDGHAAVRAQLAQLTREAPGVPVLPFPTNAFWQLSHYAPAAPYWFILDREVAFDPRNDSFAASEYNFTSVLRDFYPSLHLLSGAEFLQRHPEFIVDSAGGDLWYQLRLRGNPAYTAKPAAGLPPGDVWLARNPGAP